jgi:hypothetical protein
MMLLNFKRTFTCVGVGLLVLAMTCVGLSQVPTSETEKAAPYVSDVPAADMGSKPALVAVNVVPKQVDPVISREAIASKFETKPLVPKTTIETVVDTSLIKKQDSTDDSGWHFGVAPYLFVAGISGTVGARGRTLELGSSSGDVLAALDAGFMTAVEARKGRFVIFTDLMWVKLSSEKDTPGPRFSTAKVGVSLFVLDPEVGYRFVNSKKGSLDVLAGVRIWSVGASLTTTTGNVPGFDVSQRKSWAAPVVGVRGVANITQRFFLAGKFDIGGAGIGADLTTQLYGGAGYSFTKHVAVVGGYRWLQVDYDDEEGFLFDTQMSGALIGLKFSW